MVLRKGARYFFKKSLEDRQEEIVVLRHPVYLRRTTMIYKKIILFHSLFDFGIFPLSGAAEQTNRNT